ncbi:MAG: mechanosensitive ion channel family protein [Sandaracinaceae bacterium]|nr:mechanosensitive ion channel family protein [Sandaracinaceae bacterium]
MSWLNTSVDEATLQRVGAFFGAMLVTVVVAKLAEWIVSVKLKALADKSDTQLDDVLVDTLGRPIYLGVLIFGLRYSVELLQVPDGIEKTVGNALIVALTMLSAWTINRLIGEVYKRLVVPWVEASDSKLDDQIVPVVEKTLRIAVWTFALLICFSNLGVDVVSLLTGLGLGGLAVAMAAQDTLANIFGSITIFTDQPFQVDDLIEVDGHKGVVIDVGLRTCRIRTMSGERIRIPNKDIAAKPVVNHSFDGAWRYQGGVGMTYGTTTEQLGQALAAIQEIIDAHPATTQQGKVYFRQFGASSLEISFALFVTSPTGHRYLATISDVNVAIKERFDKEGWQMAFPSVSLYVETPEALRALGAGPRRAD